MNLQVKSPPTSLKAGEQQQYSGTISSPAPSVCCGSSTESVQRHDTPAIISRAVPVELSSRRSVSHFGPSFSSPLNQSAATQVPSPQSFSTPMTWQGNNEASTNSSCSLHQSKSYSTTINITLNYAAFDPNSPNSGTYKSGMDTFIRLCPVFLSTKPPMPYSASMTSNRSNMSSFSSPFCDINSVDGQIFAKISPDPVLSHPGHFIRHPASSLVDFTSGPLLTPPIPSLLTPDHLAQSRQHFLSLTHNFTPDQKDMDSSTLTSFSSSVLVPSPASQAPPLLMPNSLVFQ
ncbi:hypothetical protein Lal_00012255 [Lupinus albus]|nr:hypothetical protein Lal_00012255 [Lupinus albus]